MKGWCNIPINRKEDSKPTYVVVDNNQNVVDSCIETYWWTKWSSNIMDWRVEDRTLYCNDKHYQTPQSRTKNKNNMNTNNLEWKKLTLLRKGNRTKERDSGKGWQKNHPLCMKEYKTLRSENKKDHIKWTKPKVYMTKHDQM